MIFQKFDLMANRGIRHMQLFRRAREIESARSDLKTFNAFNGGRRFDIAPSLKTIPYQNFI